jgi:hypothetical protein
MVGLAERNEMLPELAIVVPTYWTRAAGAMQPGDAVYDHPTPIDGDSTLGRLLESLTVLDTTRFYVLILVAVTTTAVEAAARARVLEIVRSVSALTIGVFSAQDLPPLLQPLTKIPRACNSRAIEVHTYLGFQGYAAVRNVQLAIPYALGASTIIALDDDEVVTDPYFLERATEELGSTLDGHMVNGIAGYYMQDRTGRILLDETPTARAATNLFDRKTVIMNEATKQLERLPGRLVPTPFCFGGNMVFSRRLAGAVGFDPCITRGEDIDYLINARLEGHWFFMNKDLRILHLPPTGGSYKDVAYHKTLQDILRFVYEREKLHAASAMPGLEPLTPADLWPYPGQFLTEQLDRDALEVLERIHNELPDTQRIDAQEFMQQAHQRARAGVEQYWAFRQQWPIALQTLADDRRVRRTLEMLITNAR